MLTGLGIGTLVSLGLVDSEAKAANVSMSDADLWKYAKIDPQKAADLAYELYPDGQCMYASVKALLTTIADALQGSDPFTARIVMDFPFHMMRYGLGGIGATGSTCGAFNGCAAVMGMFVKEVPKLNAMIQELCTYYERTELPKYKPKEDNFPAMETTVAGSTLCHVSSTRWRAAANVKISEPKRADRCRRLTSDIVTKTAELLNRYHADTNCTFAPLLQPTATCFACHGPQGTKADIIGTSSCATCHQQGEQHIERF